MYPTDSDTAYDPVCQVEIAMFVPDGLLWERLTKRIIIIIMIYEY